MPSPINPDLGIVLTFLRAGQGWNQARLGDAAGVSPNLLNDYERGRKALSRKRLEYLVSFMGLSGEDIDGTLDRLAANRAGTRSAPEVGDQRAQITQRVEAVAVRTGRLTSEFVRSLFSLLTLEGEGIAARERAEVLWGRLTRRSPADRRAFVEESARFRTWALCEKAAAESVEAAAASPKDALELAHLAVRIAELCPGLETWRWRLQGYALAHVANALRVMGDLRAAVTTLAKAEKLWTAGAPGDPGLLEEAWLPWIEAALYRARRRFPDALRKLDEALSLDRSTLAGKILLTKAIVQEVMDDLTASTATLRTALPLLDARREPRAVLGAHFQILVNLCREGRSSDALAGLPAVEALTVEHGTELDLVRLTWLRGKIAAGTEGFAEAEAAFRQVKREFEARSLAYLGALVSLDLALLLLEQGRSREVDRLAKEMAWIFRDAGVPREALAALRLFCEAARQDGASAELARRLSRYLQRAQHDPELSFTDDGAGAR